MSRKHNMGSTSPADYVLPLFNYNGYIATNANPESNRFIERAFDLNRQPYDRAQIPDENLNDSLQFVVDRIIESYALYVYCPAKSVNDHITIMKRHKQDIIDDVLGGYAELTNKAIDDSPYVFFSKLIKSLSKHAIDSRRFEIDEDDTVDMLAPPDTQAGTQNSDSARRYGIINEICKAESSGMFNGSPEDKHFYKKMYTDTIKKDTFDFHNLFRSSSTAEIFRTDKDFIHHIKNETPVPLKLVPVPPASKPADKLTTVRLQHVSLFTIMYGELLHQASRRLELCKDAVDKFAYTDKRVSLVTLEFYRDHMDAFISHMSNQKNYTENPLAKYLLCVVHDREVLDKIIGSDHANNTKMHRYDFRDMQGYPAIYSNEMEMFSRSTRILLDQFIWNNQLMRSRRFAVLNNFEVAKPKSKNVKEMLKFLYTFDKRSDVTITDQEFRKFIYDKFGMAEIRPIGKDNKVTMDNNLKVFGFYYDTDIINNTLKPVKSVYKQAAWTKATDKFECVLGDETVYVLKLNQPSQNINTRKLEGNYLGEADDSDNEYIEKLKYALAKEVYTSFLTMKLDASKTTKTLDAFPFTVKDKNVEYNVNNTTATTTFDKVFDKPAESLGLMTSNMMITYSSILEQGIMAIAFGGSGVGKTSLFFGREGKEGILHRVFKALKPHHPLFEGNIHLTATIFEKSNNNSIYVLRPKQGSEIDIITHEMNATYVQQLELVQGNIQPFCEKNKIGIDAGSLQDQHIDNLFTNLTKITEYVNVTRRNGQRIKTTVNNPNSSRSALVYEFLVEYLDEKNSNTVSSFPITLVDLPGYETINDDDTTFINGLVDSALKYVNGNKDTGFLEDIGLKGAPPNAVSFVVINNSSGNEHKKELLSIYKHLPDKFTHEVGPIAEKYKGIPYTETEKNNTQWLNKAIKKYIEDAYKELHKDQTEFLEMLTQRQR